MILSIIIPVYNVEKYINGTLSSIYNQQANESMFEVIVVNDGTPDNSMEIVEKYKKSHYNLTIINQHNQGLSIARNKGFKEASGKYIWFVDSDDKIEPKSLCSLLNVLEQEQSDILGFGLTKISDDNSIIGFESPFLKQKYYSMYGYTYLGRSLYNKINIGVVQRYLYRKRFLEEESLFFYPGIWYEDDQFSVRAFYFAKKIKIIDMNIYRYLIRKSGNIMSTVSMKSIYDSEKIIQSWLDFIKENSLCYKDKTIFYDAISEYCFYIFSFRKYGLLEYNAFYSKKGKYYRKLGIITSFFSFNYISRRKILNFLAMLFFPKLISKLY